MLELLAPAGSMEALYAAVQNGANAVYLGSGIFNARQGAKNFTIQTLAEAVKYCHVRGVAVHLTLNTLVSDREMEDVCKLIREASDCGVDAFIVQDLAVARLCSQIAPHVPLHGSTQMSIHSLSGVLFCAGLGMKRVVLSRELARDEILYITQNSPIEIEVFAHGALCMCYSGQCYLSAAIGGRSGNRGRCAQPCRQSYGYGRWENRYPLSLKDNCLLPHLAELERMGVASIKLEGRMKRPEYVATVTNVYRRVLDGESVTREMMNSLSAAFNRQGFTDGYYTDRVGNSMFGIREDKYDDAKWLAAARATYEARENPLVPITARIVVTEKETVLTVADPQGRVCQVRGVGGEQARNLPLTEDALRDRLAKTGGTPYYCEDILVDIDPGLTLSAAAINGLRREALNQLIALRGRREIPETGRTKRPVIYPGAKEAPVPVIQVTAKEQITDKMLRMKPGALYVPLHILAEDPLYCHELNRRVRVAAVLPRIVTDLELESIKRDLRTVYDMGVRDVLVGNLGLLLPVRQMGFRIRGDYGLNIYNSQAVNILRELELISATLSFEMTMPQIRDVSKALPCEILVYGRLPLMVTENCLIKNRNDSCTCHLAPVKLVDRKGEEFPVIKDGNRCRSILLNGKKLNWLDRQKDLSKLGLWGIRVYFTTEGSREVDNVLESYMNPVPFDPGACTRGLYLRGLE